MSLPKPPPAYTQNDQARTREQIDNMDRQNLKRGQDIDLRTTRIIATSPDGSLWSLEVSDAGVTVWREL